MLGIVQALCKLGDCRVLVVFKACRLGGSLDARLVSHGMRPCFLFLSDNHNVHGVLWL